MITNKFASLKSISFDRLRDFILLESKGSIHAAAQGNNSRQVLISRHIRELEAFFQVKLIRHEGKKVVLTSEGMELSRIIRQQFTVFEEFYKSCQSLETHIQIASVHTIFDYFIQPHLEQILNTFPELNFNFKPRGSDVSLQDVLNLKADIGIVKVSQIPRQLKSFKITELDYYYCIPQKLLSKTDSKYGFKKINWACPSSVLR
jgi:DNA-binding transcriptional LysR family regulator